MPEGQPGQYVFYASQENSNAEIEGWGNSTNIKEIILELETRNKDGGNGYQEESRWILRAATSTLYYDLTAIESISSTIPIAGGATGITGHFNGGSLIYLKTDPAFNAQQGNFQMIGEFLVPDTHNYLPCISHDLHWVTAADTWFDQTWGVKTNGARFLTIETCYSDAYIKEISSQLQTRKLEGSDTKEECRYIQRLVIGWDGQDLKDIAPILNQPTGAQILSYPFGGSSNVLQLQLQADFYGAYGNTTNNTATGYWTMIRQSLQANGLPGSKTFHLETTYVSPSYWFDADWTKT